MPRNAFGVGKWMWLNWSTHSAEWYVEINVRSWNMACWCFCISHSSTKCAESADHVLFDCYIDTKPLIRDVQSSSLCSLCVRHGNCVPWSSLSYNTRHPGIMGCLMLLWCAMQQMVINIEGLENKQSFLCHYNSQFSPYGKHFLVSGNTNIIYVFT